MFKIGANITGDLSTFTFDKEILVEVARQLGIDTEPHVPVDTGKLKKSFKAEQIDDKSARATYDSPYAVYQHQGRSMDGRLVIKNRPAGGKTYFMSDTLIDNRDKYTQMIGKGLKINIQKGKYTNI